MLECKQKGIHDIGFVDPYIINEKMLQGHPKDMENDMFTFFTKQSLKKGNSISLQLQVSVSILYTFFFAYSMLSVIDELCMCVCSFHWILLKIQFYKSRVEIMDSLDKTEALFSDMKEMLQK
jgi:hypothetical protein